MVGNRDRWDWIHHPPSHPSPPTKAGKSPAEDEFMTPPPPPQSSEKKNELRLLLVFHWCLRNKNV